MYPRIVIGIMHAAYSPGRKEALSRLLADLPPMTYVSASEKPEHVFEYGRRMWRWAAAQDAELVCVLNDDVRVCPDFERVLSSMHKTVMGEVLGLSALGNDALFHAERGHNWIRSYQLTGQGYAAPPKVFAEMLSFWESSPFFRTDRHNADDTVGSQWLYEVQKPAWLCLPSIVQHDTRLPSAVGNGHENHPDRRTLVSWENLVGRELASTDTWRVRSAVHRVPWCENPWFPTAMLDHWRRQRRSEGAPMHITVTSTAKGDARSAARCVRSVREQNFEGWSHLFIALDEEVKQAALGAAEGDPRVAVLGPTFADAPTLANLVPIWRTLSPDDIIVWLDGDDQLAGTHALGRVQKAHADGAWVTYGQFLWSDGSMGMAAQAGPNPREEPWRATHLRSFRAGLVQKMRDSDFRCEDGSYAGYVADQRVMLGVLELAGQSRSVFIPEVLCLYNSGNSFAANGGAEEKRKEMAELMRVRTMPKYAAVERP